MPSNPKRGIGYPNRQYFSISEHKQRLWYSEYREKWATDRELILIQTMVWNPFKGTKISTERIQRGFFATLWVKSRAEFLLWRDALWSGLGPEAREAGAPGASGGGGCVGAGRRRRYNNGERKRLIKRTRASIKTIGLALIDHTLFNDWEVNSQFTSACNFLTLQESLAYTN